ncbi:YitT family protein [Intestinibacter sp.]|uniref:YitT family protein n=1 Tax=Intestinibacter sp. TaxID=1965304 RepID=UPI003F146C73
MSKANKVIGKDIFFRYSVILTGMIISSIGINGFIRPAHLLSGGVTGLATMLNYITNINVGLLTFLINIPIFVLGFIYLEKDFCITSLINMVLFSFILGITQDIGNYININDILLQSAYGGILCGVGVGLTFRAKSSQGGTDIIGAILKIKRNVPVKNTALAANVAIVLCGSFLFGMHLALYTLICMFLNAQTMSVVKDAFFDEKSVMVFTRKSEEIADDIMKNLDRGVTFLDAEGGYTHEKKKIIYCVALSKEIPKIKEIALKYDNRAFISVNDVNEVKGKGFKERYL